MAVLIEAISVVIRAQRLLAEYPGGWDAFRAAVPNDTLCADGELVRVGFMTPVDVERYVTGLNRHGLVYIRDGASHDLVVVDQMRGPMAPCDWVEFGQVQLGDKPNHRIVACRLAGSPSADVATPEGWTFERSLSASYGFIPSDKLDRSLTFIRHENGMDVYFNELTGQPVYIARTSGD